MNQKNKDQDQFQIESWLPTTKKEVEKRGWSKLDIIIITGDAYIDHPSFGHAVISRISENMGFKTAIISQPNWKDDLRDFKKFGRPKYFFGVSSGAMDSMVNLFTSNKRKRSNDDYAPGGEAGRRPEDTTIHYSRILKKIYPDIPIVIGGVEASLRRATYYDYWKDTLRASILVDSCADLLIYGTGEKPFSELLKLIKKGVPFSSIKTLPQTSFIQDENAIIPKNKNWTDLLLNTHEAILKEKELLGVDFKVIEESLLGSSNIRLLQKVKDKLVVINPPFLNNSIKDIDYGYDLPYTRLPHPKYKKRGPIPAYEMIKHSLTTHRGCFGACSFCSISAHQGRSIQSRSQESILNEIDHIAQMENFKGVITDLGGPTANMYKMEGLDILICARCKRVSCLFPKICLNLNSDHTDILDLYKKVENHPEIKKFFITSGIRYDLLINSDYSQKSKEKYILKVVSDHTSGRLKVAPEHTSEKVLKYMRKPSFELFIKFKTIFSKISNNKNLRQELIPYFISSHPGCEEKDMAHLAFKTAKLGYKLEQIQDFLPTPMTLSSVIYYTGIDPYSDEQVYVEKTKLGKLNQRKFFFWYKSENFKWFVTKLKNMKIKKYIDYFIHHQ